MDWILLMVLAYALCVSFSAVFFIRFARTRRRRTLWTALSLLLGPPGVLAMCLAIISQARRDETPAQPETLCYVGSLDGGITGEVQPLTEEDLRRRGELEGKYGVRVSTKTLQKLSGGVLGEVPSNVDKSVGGK